MGTFKTKLVTCRRKGTHKTREARKPKDLRKGSCKGLACAIKCTAARRSGPQRLLAIACTNFHQYHSYAEIAHGGQQQWPIKQASALYSCKPHPQPVYSLAADHFPPLIIAPCAVSITCRVAIPSDACKPQRQLQWQAGAQQSSAAQRPPYMQANMNSAGLAG